jgi:hypothetical protein
MLKVSRRKVILAAPALLLFKASTALAGTPHGLPAGPFDVFLISGQSNAVGNGDGINTSGLDAPSAQIFQWPGTNPPGGPPIQAIDCLLSPTNTGPLYATGVGFAMTFAKNYPANGLLTESMTQ